MGQFSRKQAKPTMGRYFWLKPAHTSPLPLKQRGLRRAEAPFCQPDPEGPSGPSSACAGPSGPRARTTRDLSDKALPVAAISAHLVYDRAILHEEQPQKALAELARLGMAQE